MSLIPLAPFAGDPCLVSQQLPLRSTAYPRGLTGHVAHPSRAIRRGERKKRSNLDKMLSARAREETDLRSIMKELINTIVQKTGISEENAQKSVQVTFGFLKTKLPAPVAAQLDSFLSARTPSPVNPVAVGANA
jgi:hypothetical protein